MMYNWLVFAHVFFAFLFMLAHGVHAAAMLTFRAEKDPARSLALLDLLPDLKLVRVLTVLLGVPGIAAAWVAGWWTQFWTWGSLVIFLIISFVMFQYGSSYFGLIQDSGRRVVEARASGSDVEAALKAYEAARLSNRTPAVTVVGLLGLAIILWLMRFKPF